MATTPIWSVSAYIRFIAQFAIKFVPHPFAICE